MAELARYSTVSQLRHALGKYAFAEPHEPDSPRREETRRVSFGFGDDELWRLSPLLPADEGALWQQVLAAASDDLFRAGEHDEGNRPDKGDVSWADAFMAVAARSLAATAVTSEAHRDRHLVLLHVETDGDGDLTSRIHLGSGVPEGLRRYLSCDSRVRAIFERGGRPVSVGRVFRTRSRAHPDRGREP